jgi:hypothetical protein
VFLRILPYKVNIKSVKKFENIMDMTPVTPDNNPDISKKIKSARKSYKIEFKSKVIEEYKKTNNYNALAKKTNLKISSIIEWVKKEYEYKQELCRKNLKRLSEGGRKIIFAGDFDQELLEWFKKERENKRAVNYKQLKNQGKQGW